MHAGERMSAHCAWRCLCTVCAIYLVLLLLLLAQIAAVSVILDNVLAHVVHSVHQQLKALLQVVTERNMSLLFTRFFRRQNLGN